MKNYSSASLLKLMHARTINDQVHHSFQRSMQVTPSLIRRLGLEVELEGHTGCVNCLEWNQNGRLVGGIDAHYASFESLEPPSFIYVMTERMDDWNPPESWKRITCIMMIYARHQNKEIAVAAQCFLNTFLPDSSDSTLVTGAADCKIRVHDLVAQETTRVYSCHVGRVKRIAVAPSLPYIFWSASEDGCIMQYDLRCPEFDSDTPGNVLINLNAHLGDEAEAKCITVNPLQPDMMAVGANDPYARLYDRRMLTCRRMRLPGQPSRFPWVHPHLDPVDGEDYALPEGCVRYFIAGDLPLRQHGHSKRHRTPASTTYVTFSPSGKELLVNLGGEQIYLFDVNSAATATPLKYLTPASLYKTDSKVDCLTGNGFNLNRNGTVSNGFSAGTMHSSTILRVGPIRSPPAPDDPAVDGDCFTDSVCQRGSDLSASSVFAVRLKELANDHFRCDQFSQAIYLYNRLLLTYPSSPVLLVNRAASYMKRNWNGDVYAALRDCHDALQLNPDHMKAHFCMARCLYELDLVQEAFQCLMAFKLKFSDYRSCPAVANLEKSINAAFYSRTEEGSGKNSGPDESLRLRREVILSEQEKKWREEACDYRQRYCGHCNTTTDIKEANFFGSNGQYIVAGSDDGSFFIWDRCSTNIVQVLRGDDSIVNCLQPHPTSCLLATGGIDPVVRLWSPLPEDGTRNAREVMNSVDAASANQKRMNIDPLEVMLLNMGYRVTGFLDMDEERSDRESSTSCQTS